MFDLYYFPICINAGREESDLPGLLVSQPPRRAARLRSGDLLIALFSQAGSTPLAPAAAQELLARLAETYYATPGSVTSGMRAAIEEVNETLLNRNLRANRGENWQSLGILNLAVIHNEQVLMALAGPTHTFVLTRAQVQDLTDGGMAGRGLGASRAVTPRYLQAEIQPGDLLVLSPNPAATWTEKTLAGSPVLTLDALRRRLLNQVGPELRAAVIQLQSGKGVVHRLKPRPILSMASETPAPPARPQPQPSGAAGEAASTPRPPLQRPVASRVETPPPPAAAMSSPSQPRPAAVMPAPVPAPHPEAPQPQPSTTPQPVEDTPPAAPAVAVEPPVAPIIAEEPAVAPLPPLQRPAPTRPEAPASPPAPPVQPPQATGDAAPNVPAEPAQADSATQAPAQAPLNPPEQGEPRWRSILAAAWKKAGELKSAVGARLRAALPRLLPSQGDLFPPLSPGMMTLIGVAVPVVVVAIAMTVYLRLGSSETHRLYLQEAISFAEQASTQADPILQRSNWEQALHWLDQAEEYQQTDESKALRQRAQQMLDRMDRVERLDFRPAMSGGLGSIVQVHRMVTSNDDLYVLDGAQGRVLRVVLAGNRYEQQTSFVCGPGKTKSGLIISQLVDVVALPPGNRHNAAVVSIDTTGNLLFCGPSLPEPVAEPLPPPSSQWGRITALSRQLNDLYILDTGPNTRAVWRYRPTDEGYTDQPTFFFAQQVPELETVVDMAVQQDELYLLHQNGQMTTCTYSAFEDIPTRCTAPAPYGDERPGNEAQPLTLPEAHLIQLQTAQVTEPSIYALDSKAPSIYHLSLRLNLNRQFRTLLYPDFPLPNQPATAFTVSASKQLFVAFGNQVFITQLP